MSGWIPLTHIAVAPMPNRIIASSGTTHAQWQARVQSMASHFADAGIRTVAIYEPDVEQFAAYVFGALHAGAQVVLLPDDLAATLEAATPRVDQVLTPSMPLRQNPAVELRPLAPLDEQYGEIALFTSGSTGEPALVAKKLRQFFSEVATLELIFGAEYPHASVMGTVSHQHIYGFLFRVLWPLAAGRQWVERMFFAEQWSGDAVRSAILVATPAHLKRIPETASKPPALRTIFSSGGALHPADAARLSSQWQIPVIEIYGSSETGGIAWRRSSAEDAQVNARWSVMPTVSVQVNDGELWVKSPHLADTNWCNTQDRVNFDGESFELLGRADRIVKVEERRVSLAAVESAIGASPWVCEAHVETISGSNPRAMLGAVVRLHPDGIALLNSHGRRTLIAAIQQGLRLSVTDIAIPKVWRFVSAFPVNDQGKTTRRALLNLLKTPRPKFEVVEQSADRVVLSFELQPDNAVLDGHFPGTPILPGVAQLDWAARNARQYFGCTAPLYEVTQLKFQSILQPGEFMTLTLTHDAAQNAVAFEYASATRCSSGKLRFRPSGPYANPDAVRVAGP